VTEVVARAASNGDRSENADYQYGKRRLRQIDGRIRFLTKRIEAAEVVAPETPRTGQAAKRAFFGATVRYATDEGTERVVSIVGADEVDLDRNHINWVSMSSIVSDDRSGPRGGANSRVRSALAPPPAAANTRFASSQVWSWSHYECFPAPTEERILSRLRCLGFLGFPLPTKDPANNSFRPTLGAA